MSKLSNKKQKKEAKKRFHNMDFQTRYLVKVMESNPEAGRELVRLNLEEQAKKEEKDEQTMDDTHVS